MRKTYLTIVLFAFVLAGFIAGCVRPFSPSAPSGIPTATPSPTATPFPTSTGTPYPTPHATPSYAPPPTGIYVYGLVQVSSNMMNFTVDLSVNGAPEATDTVNLITPSGSIPAAFQANSSNLSQYYSGWVTAAGNYQFGGTYVLSVSTSLGAASATLTAPGPVSIATDGSSAAWTQDGNEDYVWVQESLSPFTVTYQSYAISEDVDSPSSIPASAYPAPGSYTVYGVAQNTTYNVIGADAGSRFTFSDFGTASVSK
jgi:hypothetical protein